MRHIKFTLKVADFTPYSEIYHKVEDINPIIMPSFLERMFAEWLTYNDMPHFKLELKIGDTIYKATSHV